MFIGVVGKPNCGKSTFFKAATLADVLIANYPFATIKPNSGVGFVRVECIDKDFGAQCNPREGFCINHVRFVPVQLVDVAGLVPGAHEGKGLGNQFLNDLSQADALIHVIDAAGSTNERGEPVEPLSYDPSQDIKFLEVELDEWYYGILLKGWERFAKTCKMEKKEPFKAIAKQFSGLRVTEEMAKRLIEKLGLKKDDASAWSEPQLKDFAKALRKETKPMIIAANKADIPGAMDNVIRLQKEFPDYIIIPTSAELELLLKEAAKKGIIKYTQGEPKFDSSAEGAAKLSDAQKKALEYVQNFMNSSTGGTGVQNALDSAVFKLLKYVAIFPGGVNKLADSNGNVLPDCFLMPPGTTALSFAYRLHSDFGDHFVKAINVKTKMPIGKEHVLANRDCVEIHSTK